MFIVTERFCFGCSFIVTEWSEIIFIITERFCFGYSFIVTEWSEILKKCYLLQIVMKQ